MSHITTKRLKFVVRPIVKKVPFGDVDCPYIGLEHIESWTGRIRDSQGVVPEGIVSLFQPQDILFGKLRPYLAKVVLTDFVGACSTEALVLRPNGSIWPPYLRYILGDKKFIDEVDASTFGAKMPRASWEFIGSQTVPVPNVDIQKIIAAFLDRETARIDHLIERRLSLLTLVRPKWEALIHDSLSASDTKHIRFGFAANRISRRIERDPEEAYTPLGLYNRGRGAFRKDSTSGSDLGDSDFSWVKEGDLIFSGQFAWEGAVAFAGIEEGGCVVSHRYHVYRGRKGVDTAYLYAFFRTAHGQFLLSESSRGAAGRNRPLNPRLLEKEKIPIPAAQVQAEIAELVRYERQLSDLVSKSIERLKEYRSALITAAVTGQIDVTTWSKRGATDRQIYRIETDYQAPAEALLSERGRLKC